MRWIVMLSCVIAGLFLAGGLLFSKGAPQEAAMAAMACAFAIIPYVFYRAMQIADADEERREFYKALMSRLEALEAQPADQK